MLISTEKRVDEATSERWELTPEDGEYPHQLLDLERPPKCLYGIGSREVLSTRSLAVIGARRATPYGIAVAEMAGRIAAECGITVVSGGALGCDAAALRAAQRAGGSTIPTRAGFPKRNRIIAALSEALMVAEAGERSGTSSTAECASSLGRTIYAVPGSIFSPESVGANRLIVDGALPIVSEEDLEMRISLDFNVMRLLSGGGSREFDRVLSALVAMPMRTDDLANRLGENPLELLMKMAELEASGVVTRLPDGRYAPSKETLLTR